MRTEEIIKAIPTIAAVLSVVIEIVPVKICPFSPLRWLGRRINGDLAARVEMLTNDLNRLRSDSDERNAKLMRSHILAFGDELLHNTLHSKEAFEQILADIDEYDRYCREHPKFKNGVTVAATARIRETYLNCLERRSFL